MGNCAVFVDAGYAEKVFASEHPGQRIDYAKLAKNMCMDDKLRNPVHRGHQFQRKADSLPVIADTG